MTRHKSFKRLVRSRMEKTGESYTAARAMLLDPPSSDGPDRALLATSDEAIRERTGRGWEEWFDLLDEAGAAEKTHRENARWLASLQGLDPLAWNVQAVVGSYEKVRGLRVAGEKEDGSFSISVSKTVAAPVARLYEAFVDPVLRGRWLPDAELVERTATRPKRARFDWGDGTTRVVVGFAEAGSNKSRVAISHERLGDADEAERMKAFWRERVAALKEVTER